MAGLRPARSSKRLSLIGGQVPTVVPSDLVSLADASSILGVSAERVRQLVVAGDLLAARFGNAWAVPRSALLARRHSSRPGGRPLGVYAAWREIVLGAVDLGRPGRYQRRERVVRGEMSNADLDSLRARVGALQGGVGAPSPTEQR